MIKMLSIMLKENYPIFFPQHISGCGLLHNTKLKSCIRISIYFYFAKIYFIIIGTML